MKKNVSNKKKHCRIDLNDLLLNNIFKTFVDDCAYVYTIMNKKNK